jgi:Domain of unknown function (DUF6265)
MVNPEETMMIRRLILAVLAFVLAAPLQAADPKTVKVDDLGWMAGRWTGTMGEDSLEEQWSAPAGGAMMGMFRWMKKNGAVSVYEFLTIEPSAEGPVYFMRHFNSGLIAWEEKDAPLRCPLTASGPREATFACDGGATKLTFKRTHETTMTVLLERQRDGKPMKTEFTYTLGK